MTMPNQKALLLLGIGVFAGFVVLMLFVPRLVPLPPGTINAASVQGYNTPVATLTAQVWTIAAVMMFAICARLNGRASKARTFPQDNVAGDWHEAEPEAAIRGRLAWGEITAVFVLFSAAYCPLFLARYGTYIEDNYFISCLQRMHHGQTIYRDFGFFYGPLMIYPAYAWTTIFGFSMTSYFSYLAVLQGATFAILIGVLQRFITNRWARYLVFLLLLPILFDTLFGLNWNGLRRMVPALAALVVALRPYERSTLILGSLLLGLHLAYSHDYAAAALAAVLGVYGVSFLRGEGRRALMTAAGLALGSALIWMATIGLLLGRDTLAYLEHAREIVATFSSGLGAFRFYWTANSLALFGLLTVVCCAVGSGLFRERTKSLSSGDRLLLCSLLYALVTLKSGLNRADVWHLNAPFLIILFAVLLPLPTRVFSFGQYTRKLSFGLIAVVSFTYLVGIYPTWRMYASGYVGGLRDVISGRGSSVTVFSTQSHSVEFERSKPRRNVIAITRFLSQEQFARRDIFFYAHAWKLGSSAGVCRTTYGVSDEMLFDRDRHYLSRHPNAVVVMTKPAYERLYGLADANQPYTDPRLSPGISRTAQRWLSTVHLGSIAHEQRIEADNWQRFIGNDIRAKYVLVRDLKSHVILLPSEDVKNNDAGHSVTPYL